MPMSPPFTPAQRALIRISLENLLVNGDQRFDLADAAWNTPNATQIVRDALTLERSILVQLRNQADAAITQIDAWAAP